MSILEERFEMLTEAMADLGRVLMRLYAEADDLLDEAVVLDTEAGNANDEEVRLRLRSMASYRYGIEAGMRKVLAAVNDVYTAMIAARTPAPDH